MPTADPHGLSKSNKRQQDFERQPRKMDGKRLKKEMETFRRHCKNCCTGAELRSKALDVIFNDAESTKDQPIDLSVTHKSKAALSLCNQANARQDVNSPDSLDMHHPLTISKTPPESPADPQTVPSLSPEAGHPPQQSVSIQLSPRFQPLSQSLSDTADSQGTAPTTIHKSTAIQHKTRKCSSSKSLGVTKMSSSSTKKPSTRTFKPIRATRTIMERPVKKSENSTSHPGRLIDDNRDGCPGAMDHGASAKKQPPLTVAVEIVARFAKELKEKASRSTTEELTLFCLCKVLKAMGVGTLRLRDLVMAERYSSSFEKLFDGVVWANYFLQQLFAEGWGHSGVDYMLACKSGSRRCMKGGSLIVVFEGELPLTAYVRLAQFGATGYSEPKTLGTKPLKNPKFDNWLVKFLKDPAEYRAKYLPTSMTASKSLPARLGEILSGVVS